MNRQPEAVQSRRRFSRDESPLGSYVTLAGVVSAATLMAGALLLMPVRPDVGPKILHDPLRQVNSFIHLDPMAWAAIGCMILAITPVLRVVLLALWTARVGRRSLAIVAFLIVAVLIAAIAIAWRPLSGPLQ